MILQLKVSLAKDGKSLNSCSYAGEIGENLISKNFIYQQDGPSSHTPKIAHS